MEITDILGILIVVGGAGAFFTALTTEILWLSKSKRKLLALGVLLIFIGMIVIGVGVLHHQIRTEERKLFEINIVKQPAGGIEYLALLKKLNSLPREDRKKILNIKDVEIVTGRFWRVFPNKIQVSYEGSAQEIKNYILNNLSTAREKGRRK